MALPSFKPVKESIVKILKTTMLFAILVPVLSHAQANMPSSAGASGSQQMQSGSQQGNSECVGPHSYCNLFAGS
jgi:hypothetical protein